MTDYGKLGLKCGLEIHQQLDTEHKLFCSCRSGLSAEGARLTIKRKLHAVAGEMGDVDLAAAQEALKGKTFNYNVYQREDCLVETDSEPPHELNPEALEVALQTSLMLNCEIPDEIHVMRKTVIDGSNTSGFQRTAIAGMDGSLEASGGRIGITNVCIEEDAAQILGRTENEVMYGLDRLGIPLVEIGTAPDIRTPEQAKEVAQHLGMILRSTGKAKRGLGTIRQDVNVSIKGGARIEIKGAQKLNLIPLLVESEALRQQSLIRIRSGLLKSGFKPVKPTVRDVSRLFRRSECKLVAGKPVFAVIIPGFAGYLGRKLTRNKTLGRELADYARVKAGIKGIIHSDENLQKYRLESDFEALGKHMGAKPGDTVIMMSAGKDIADRTARAMEERINMLVKTVPNEVRKALEDGETEYLRPLPGAARMYPETDVPPITIDPKALSKLESSLPETWTSRIDRLSKRVGKDVARQLVHSGKEAMFERLSKIAEAGYVANVLTSMMKELERDGFDVGALEESHLSGVFRLLKEKRLAKEAVPEVLKELAKKPDKKPSDIVKGLGIKTVDTARLQSIIKTILKEKRDLLSHPNREKMLMGLVMKEVRGKIDGRTVMETLRKELGNVK